MDDDYMSSEFLKELPKERGSVSIRRRIEQMKRKEAEKHQPVKQRVLMKFFEFLYWSIANIPFTTAFPFFFFLVKNIWFKFCHCEVLLRFGKSISLTGGRNARRRTVEATLGRR